MSNTGAAAGDTSNNSIRLTESGSGLTYTSWSSAASAGWEFFYYSADAAVSVTPTLATWTAHPESGWHIMTWALQSGQGTFAVYNSTLTASDHEWGPTIGAETFDIDAVANLHVGTVGTVTFSSSSADGRVVDENGTAVNQADVFFRQADGTTVAKLQTNTAGDFGPVYVDESVTAFAQKSGYSGNSGAITVTGTSVAGPGANIALTSVSVAGSLSASTLLAYIKRVARDVGGTKADTIALEILNDSMLLVAKKHLWPYFRGHGELRIRGAYDTGTITTTVSSTSVTLAGGTFPAWVDQYSEIRYGTQWYPIALRTSDTEVQLATAWIETALSGATYSVYKDRYELPTDFYRFIDLYPGGGWRWDADPVSVSSILDEKQQCSVSHASASHFAIDGDRTLRLWPFPNEDAHANFGYWRRPDKVTSESDTLDFDANLEDLLHAAIDYQVASRYGQNDGEMSPRQLYAVFEQLCKESMNNATGSPSKLSTRRRRGYRQHLTDPRDLT